jgi:Icc-related predicted phosphoesterase
MKVLYASDLHGEIDHYRQLFELTEESTAEIIALGGDLLPSMRQNTYEEMVPAQKSFIERFLLTFFRKCLKITGVRHILLIPGNWDVTYPKIFNEPVEGVIDLDRKKLQLPNGYEWIGYPFVPPTPFRPKNYEKMDDLKAPWPPQKSPSYIWSPDAIQLTPIDPYLFLRERGTIQEDLKELPRPENERKAIYMMHSPPYRNGLDRIQGGEPAGSRSIRAFIENHQPLLTLHGHIHESPEISGQYSQRIGDTLSINPGQSFRKDRGFPRLHAVTFKMENPEYTIIHSCF